MQNDGLRGLGDNLPEGGFPQMEVGASADAPFLMLDPEQLYYHGKAYQDVWLRALAWLDSGLHGYVKLRLQETKNLSTREIADIFMRISDAVWAHNDTFGLWHRLWGLGASYEKIPIQEKFNNRLCVPNADGKTLDYVKSDDIVPLFASKNPADWPRVFYTSNHARAWRSTDLTELTSGIERLGQDATGKPLDIYRFTHKPPMPNDAAGKTIVLLACSTERDMYRNGARLIHRRLDLLEDPNAQNPAKRTRENISPAALRLAKLLIKTMAEPRSQRLINLDCANIDMDPELKKHPFIADHLVRMSGEDIRFEENNPVILRADAAAIADRFRGIGFSLGCNTVTDTVRFFKQECAALGTQLKISCPDGSYRTATEADIRAIISHLELLNLAPGEVPLTQAEREFGMQRASILNTQDMTAGHLVNPNTAQYDRRQDRLIKIEGAKEHSGHSIVHMLGKAGPNGHWGFLMDPANADRPHYEEAQAAVRRFFSEKYKNEDKKQGDVGAHTMRAAMRGAVPASFASLVGGGR